MDIIEIIEHKRDKKKLSKAGVLIFESLFSKIASANKTTYILIDNYYI